MPFPSPSDDARSPIDRYFALIDQIVETTLKGKIRSKEQVYQMLLQGVPTGTGEIFERCLFDRVNGTQEQIRQQKDEMKLVKANRILRALQTIQGEWERWQEQNQAAEALMGLIRQVTEAEAGQKLAVFTQSIDPNRPQGLTVQQWRSVAALLQKQGDDPFLQDLAEGLTRTLTTWPPIADHLVSWIYDQSQEQIGFGGVPGQRGPWAVWAKQSASPILQSFFQTLALEKPLTEWVDRHADLSLSDWVELTLVMQSLQQGLVAWFDKLVYDAKVGAKLSISVYLTFAALWSQLASGFQRVSLLPSRSQAFVEAAFQMTLQILRTFAQREYFPLYGGIFASFSGQYLRNALDYLDEPLRRTEGTQEKARILVLLGYSARVQGQYDRANTFHQQALEIAREAADRPCEIASLNHLSHTCLAQKHYAEAIQYSQRALVLSRQTGDRPGEANALAALGYSEVLQAQFLEQADPDVYETPISFLEQGLTLSERLGDRQSHALCLSSLGIAHLVLAQYPIAVTYLERAVQTSQFVGDLYLLGSNLAYLGEAYYHLQNFDLAIYTAAVGMYFLEQIASNTWRQPAGLLAILQGQMGEEAFHQALQGQRSRIIAAIGVDGYDYLPELIQRW
ncbi:MAG: tetratricopeptide repeat protein [Leptolyngbyaceae cyanobacterium bins.59]|nr:tetratricopeptide repeat protein [Leptolyngbyaceae cyanobacterium bins.59]